MKKNDHKKPKAKAKAASKIKDLTPKNIKAVKGGSVYKIWDSSTPKL